MRRDRAVQVGSFQEVFTRTRFQEIGAVALAALLVREARVGALQVVDRRHGARAVAERRVRGDVVHALGADVDHAPVA